MTTIQTANSGQNAQIVRRDASGPRPPDAEPARAFLEVLGDLERPPAEPDPAENGADAGTAEGKTDRPDEPSPEKPEPADAAGAADEPIPVTVGPGRPPTHTAEVNQELHHAAVVDVAEIAREEMAAPAPKNPGKHGNGPGEPLSADPPPLTASNPPPGKEPGSPPRPAGETAGVPEPKARPVQEPVPPRPGAEPVTTDADGASADPARTQAARVVTPPARADAEHAAVGAGRTTLLTKLTGSAEAARGAVSGAERVGGQPLQRDAGPVRTPVLAGPASPRTLREQVLGQVQRGLASMMTQGGGRMTVVLRPEQLGEVRVHMEARAGVVKARMSASTDAARQTLESGLETLRAALEARGVRVDSLEIDGPAPDAGRSDPDGGGGSRQQRDREGHATRDPDHGRGHRPATEPAAGRFLWTELGIDAVA